MDPFSIFQNIVDVVPFIPTCGVLELEGYSRLRIDLANQDGIHIFPIVEVEKVLPWIRLIEPDPGAESHCSPGAPGTHVDILAGCGIKG